ncbi:hypothetical protein Y886_23505 [Xanthomonas hyacinthi DSM 19077]|nr:hypothetical protein Y886_23505 [Xanthomonas hyacinthi DSM 19077]
MPFRAVLNQKRRGEEPVATGAGPVSSEAMAWGLRAHVAGGAVGHPHLGKVTITEEGAVLRPCAMLSA